MTWEAILTVIYDLISIIVDGISKDWDEYWNVIGSVNISKPCLKFQV